MDGLNKIDLKLEKPITSNDAVHISPARMTRKIDFKKLEKFGKVERLNTGNIFK